MVNKILLSAKDISQLNINTDVFDMIAINATHVKLISGGKKVKAFMSIFLCGWNDVPKITTWRPQGFSGDSETKVTSLEVIPKLFFDKTIHLIPYLKGYKSSELGYNEVVGKNHINHVIRDFIKREYTSDDLYYISILLRNKNGVWFNKISKTKPLSDLFNKSTLRSDVMNNKTKNRSTVKKIDCNNMIGDIKSLSENLKNLI